MCKFASFIMTKTGEFWCASDKHEDIIAAQKLDDTRSPPDFVRVELLPNESTRKDLSTWMFVVDQDVLPTWTFARDPELERRSREALSRRAKSESWFAEVIADLAVSGYAGTATAGDDGILNIRWWDGKRRRVATFYVGEDGIEPNIGYGADERGKAVRKAGNR